MDVRWFGALLVLALQGPAPVPNDTLPADLTLAPPFGLPEAIPDPRENAFSAERLDLGRRLFFEPALSLDRSVACASCHRPEHGLADDRPLSTGVAGRKTLRNAPTLFNRAFGAHQMWDGRGESLEHQVLLPIENELEMALPLEQALERLRGDAKYAASFESAYGGVSRENLAKALSLFVRRLTFADSPVDRFRVGEVTGLSREERAGMWLFESRGRCWKCHHGPNFSDEEFHNTGVGVKDGAPEPGRAAISAKDEDLGRFKTPTLRALALTAPYMHDGSLATLADVVEFYSRGGNANSHRDPEIEPIELTPEEKTALAAFLGALSRH
jgi:cytochrome c peroxidase